MDDADRAQLIEQRNLERAIAAARGVPVTATRWQHCHDCSVELPEVRQHIGLCVPCKAAREAFGLRRV